nr:hypothetical protein [Vibrio vulnificus]
MVFVFKAVCGRLCIALLTP